MTSTTTSTAFWKQTRDNGPNLVEALTEVRTQLLRMDAPLFNQLTEAKDLIEAKNRDMLCEFQRAVRFFILNRITFSGVVDSGGYSQSAYEKTFHRVVH